MHNFYDFFKYLGFTIYNPEQDRWVKKSDKYDGYEYISTRMGKYVVEVHNIDTKKNVSDTFTK